MSDSIGSRSVRGCFAFVVAIAVLAMGVTATSLAAPPPLHLNAVVYDVHTVGATVSSKEKLFEGKTLVGEDISRCTNHGQTAKCEGTYTLKHGTLKISGTIAAHGSTNRLSLVGSTGTYKGVHGTVVTEYNKPGTRAKETLTF